MKRGEEENCLGTFWLSLRLVPAMKCFHLQCIYTLGAVQSDCGACCLTISRGGKINAPGLILFSYCTMSSLADWFLPPGQNSFNYWAALDSCGWWPLYCVSHSTGWCGISLWYCSTSVCRSALEVVLQPSTYSTYSTYSTRSNNAPSVFLLHLPLATAPAAPSGIWEKPRPRVAHSCQTLAVFFVFN